MVDRIVLKHEISGVSPDGVDSLSSEVSIIGLSEEESLMDISHTMIQFLMRMGYALPDIKEIFNSGVDSISDYIEELMVEFENRYTRSYEMPELASLEEFTEKITSNPSFAVYLKKLYDDDLSGK